eukprot:m51a1_g11135 putative coenzyme a transferase (541) ;mRNA; f:182168-184678
MDSIAHSGARRKHAKPAVVTAAEAVSHVSDGDVVTCEGFVGAAFPEELALALRERYEASGGRHPRGLTLFYAASQGDSRDGHGLSHFANEGMLARVVGGHWGLMPKLVKLAVANKLQAYNLPMGVISHMFRDMAARKPRTVTHVGLGTFVDPRINGGKLNEAAKEDLVELVHVDGHEYLSYKHPERIDVAMIRGTTADTRGNITVEREALTIEMTAVATAAHNRGGIVIVQVERVVEAGTLNPRDVKIPGVLVDYIVVASKPEFHMQTFGVQFSPEYACHCRTNGKTAKPMPLDERKVIARRAAFALRPDTVVNLGFGIPEGVACVADEEGVEAAMTLTTEAGSIGGVPAGGLDFGCSSNMECLLDMPAQFDFYHGGGLDLTILGLAQVDQHGNLNVSKFGPRIAGAGGFIDISQNARSLVFVGTFTAGALRVRVGDGRLAIEQEGPIAKFVKEVEHITFSARVALESGQNVLYVTERCVFRLVPEGLELVEVAPGIDVERDVLAHMQFRPIVRGTPATMDPRIFREGLMNLKEDIDNYN